MTSKTGRVGMFGSLRSLVRGTSTRSAKAFGNSNGNGKTTKAKSTSNLQGPTTTAASNKGDKKSNGRGGGGGAAAGEDNMDGSPSSQSSFFSGRTGEASASSGASTPIGPESLSPAPLSSSRSHPNKPRKKRSGGGGGGGGGSGRAVDDGGAGDAGAGSPGTAAYRAGNTGMATNSAGDEADRYYYGGGDGGGDDEDADHDDGGGGGGGGKRQQPPSYESLFLSGRGFSGEEKVAAAGAGGGGGGRGGGYNKRSSSARSYTETPRGQQPHILKTQQAFSAATRSSSSNAVAHMSPAERAALREAGEEGIADLDLEEQEQQEQQEQRQQRQRQQHGHMPQYQERTSGRCDDDEDGDGDGDGDDPSVETAEQEDTPRKQQVGVTPMEKAYIRSLAEIDATVVADNKRQRPLLADVPRPQLYGAIPAPHGGGDGVSLGGLSTKKVAMGPKKTLVLDLDETLVSSSRTPCDCDYKIVFKIHSRERPDPNDTFAAIANAPGGGGGGNAGSFEGEEIIRELHYYVRLRPGLSRFLKKVAAFYELVVWTASGQSYADAIIDLLDPTGELFAARLYRDSCVRHHNLCVKDLRRLGRPMNSVLLLDNYVYSFGLTLDNGVPISPWTGEQEAKESGLTAAYSLLRGMSRFPDVRSPLITAFDLHKKIYGYQSAAAAGPAARGGASSRQQRHQRSRFHNPLSPVASCSAVSSPSSSDSSSDSSESSDSSDYSASTPTATSLFTFFRGGGRASPPPPPSRAPPVGAGPLSPVAAVWAANAAARAEEERLEARRRAQPQPQPQRASSLRSTAEGKFGRQQRQQQPWQQQQQQQQQQRGGAKKKQGEQTMQAKLAEQVRDAKDLKRQRQLEQQQQRRQQQQLAATRLQQMQQAAGATAAMRTGKRETSGEEGARLSPVVARWAADAAVRAHKEAKAARAAAAAERVLVE